MLLDGQEHVEVAMGEPSTRVSEQTFRLGVRVEDRSAAIHDEDRLRKRVEERLEPPLGLHQRVLRISRSDPRNRRSRRGSLHTVHAKPRECHFVES